VRVAEALDAELIVAVVVLSPTKVIRLPEAPTG
jgi:hypothetical protein